MGSSLERPQFLLNKKLRFWGPFSKVGIGPSLVLGPSTKVGLWAFKKTWRPRPGLDPDPSLALTHLVLVLGPPSVLMLGWSLLDTISPYPKIVMDDCPYWGSFVCEYDLRATCSSSLMMKKNSLCILQVVYLLSLSFISTIHCKNFPRFWGYLQMDISSRVLWYIYYVGSCLSLVKYNAGELLPMILVFFPIRDIKNCKVL